MNITRTIQLTELLWTIVALPGLLLWVNNRMRAQASLRATKRLEIGNGRRAFARFAVRETTAWAFIEALFVAIGVVSMTYEPNPSSNDLSRLVIVVGLIGASFMITILGAEWRRVDQELVRTAVAKMTTAQNARQVSQDARDVHQDLANTASTDTTTAQDTREVVQNVREEEQNTRDENQDLREAGQNDRASGQNDRQAQQDARDADTGSE